MRLPHVSQLAQCSTYSVCSFLPLFPQPFSKQRISLERLHMLQVKQRGDLRAACYPASLGDRKSPLYKRREGMSGVQAAWLHRPHFSA